MGGERGKIQCHKLIKRCKLFTRASSSFGRSIAKPYFRRVLVFFDECDCVKFLSASPSSGPLVSAKGGYQTRKTVRKKRRPVPSTFPEHFRRTAPFDKILYGLVANSSRKNTLVGIVSEFLATATPRRAASLVRCCRSLQSFRAEWGHTCIS